MWANSHRDEVEVTIRRYSCRLRQLNCVSIITLMIIQENKIIDQFPTPKHQQI